MTTRHMRNGRTRAPAALTALGLLALGLSACAVYVPEPAPGYRPHYHYYHGGYYYHNYHAPNWGEPHDGR